MFGKIRIFQALNNVLTSILGPLLKSNDYGIDKCTGKQGPKSQVNGSGSAHVSDKYHIRVVEANMSNVIENCCNDRIVAFAHCIQRI